MGLHGILCFGVLFTEWHLLFIKHGCQIFTAFRPQLFPQLIEGYWRVFALMAVGFLLHFAPDSWENAVCRGVIKLPFLGKAIVMVAMIYLVIQMKSSEIQPFIYFQF